MSLATRCTSCGTAFRVVQDQLKVSEGWVRCGRCDAVFNALEGLFDLGRDAPADWEEPTEPLVGNLALPHAEGSAPPAAPTEDVAAEPDGDEIDATPSGGDEAPSTDLGELLADPVDAHLFGPRKRSEAKPKPAGQLGARDRVEFSDARFDSDLFLDNTSIPDTELATATAAEAETTVLESAVRPDFVRRADRRARWQSAPVRAVLGALCAVAALALGAQLLNYYRDTIAAQWPSLRPVVAAWCQAAQCRIEPPRRIKDMRIETSALTRAPGQDTFVLSVTLKNRSDLALAMPSIDLTLNDANDRLVARRALAPEDLRAANVIAPRAETPLEVVLSAGSSSVFGYTVEIFYP